MRAAAADVCGEFADTFPVDTRNLIGFYMSLRRLFSHCGIQDFALNDLYKPTYDRLARIFSYLINFVQFRESQTGIIDEHYNKPASTKTGIQILSAEIQDKEALLGEMQYRRKTMEEQVRAKTLRNEELKQRLLELRRNQQNVAARLKEAKQKRSELNGKLEEKTLQMAVSKQESNKLRPYTVQSPSALQDNLSELRDILDSEKAHIENLDRRARGLQTSIDSFAVVSTDVASCIKILDEIATELAREEEELIRNAKQRDALSERGNNAREVDHAEAMLKRQLDKWNERTRKLRSQSNEKAQEANNKMHELRTVHKKLTEEHTERGKEMEIRRVRIEQTEKKVRFSSYTKYRLLTYAQMLDLKEHIESEVHAAYDEYLKMEAHIKLYITEMEQIIS